MRNSTEFSVSDLDLQQQHMRLLTILQAFNSSNLTRSNMAAKHPTPCIFSQRHQLELESGAQRHSRHPHPTPSRTPFHSTLKLLPSPAS